MIILMNKNFGVDRVIHNTKSIRDEFNISRLVYKINACLYLLVRKINLIKVY